MVDGFPVNTTNTIEFKDPWLIDSSDSKGNLNRGTNAIFRSIGTPFNALTGNTVYNGVFLNQDPNIPGNPYFSIRAQLTNTNVGGFTGYFQNWSYNTNQISMQQMGASQSGYDTKAVVFKNAGATVTANYKALHVSSNAAAYRNNSQRKIVKNNLGKVLTAYESQGNIWVEASTDNGATWTFEYFDIQNKPAPINTRAAKSPSLTISGGVTILTYQELNTNPNYTDIKVVHLYYWSNGATPPVYTLQPRIVGTITVYNPSNLDLNPVSSNYYDIVVGGGGATQSTGSSVVNRVSTTWEEGGYLKVKCGAFYTNSSSSSVTWGTSVYTITNGRHAAMAANSSANYIVWEQPNSSSSSDIKFLEYTVESNGSDYTVQVVNQTTPSSGSGFTKNYNPSIIAVSGGARMCWIGYRGTIEGQSATETQGMTAIGGSEQRVVFRDVYYNHFWQFGSNVGSPTITKSDDNTSYYIMWSENDGQYNKFADNSLSTVRTINTTGADVQVTNAYDRNSMFAIAFQTAPVPYRFVKSNTLGSYYGMAKSGGDGVQTGREGIVSIGNGSTFFAFGDVTVDNQPIPFVDIADTISVSSVKELNEYLQTKPFRLTKNRTLGTVSHTVCLIPHS